MDTLLAVLLTWLSVTLGLPMTHAAPRVELASAAAMTEVRYRRLAAYRAHQPAADLGLPGRVHAIYDDAAHVIYLPEGWSASSSADVSMLVHELVHHVQNVNALRYTCAGEREKPAYQAQARWLELFGKTLADEFGLDPMTLLVRTNCMR